MTVYQLYKTSKQRVTLFFSSAFCRMPPAFSILAGAVDKFFGILAADALP